MSGAHAHEAAPARTDETTQDGKDTRLGPFRGWRRCPAGREKLQEWVYRPGAAAGTVLPFPVLTDAIPQPDSCGMGVEIPADPASAQRGRA